MAHENDDLPDHHKLSTSGHKTDEQLSAEERERRALLAEADIDTSSTLFVGADTDYEQFADEVSRLKSLLDDHDPDTKHSVYYGLQALIKKNIQAGERVRRMVYDEKNIYINRGKALNEDGIRGSDGRMASIEILTEAIDIVSRWLRSGGTATGLYMAFYNANESKGYPHQVDVNCR